MNDWPHKLFSDGVLSDFLVDRWQHFAKEMKSAYFDALLSRYLLRVPTLDMTKMTIAKWGELEPLPDDFPSRLDYIDARIAFLKGQLTNQRQTFILVSIPFQGDGDLFRLRPGGCTLPAPQGLLGEKSIQLRFERSGSEDRDWETCFRTDMNTINAFLEAASDAVNGFNQRISGVIPTEIWIAP